MLTGKYKSLRFVVEKVFRDSGYVDEVDIEDVIEWAGECLELIGVPESYVAKQELITIKDGRGLLPCDLLTLRQVRFVNEDKNKSLPMVYNTSNFHKYLSHECSRVKEKNCGERTYTLSDNCIFTGFDEGYVEIAYEAFPTDENGWPKIPDNIKFVKAIEYYIREKIDYLLWRAGKLPQAVYMKTEQEQVWYLAAAQSAGVMPNADRMENIKNNWLRLIPKINQHSDYFASFGNEEQRINHNGSRYNNMTNEVDRDELFGNINL